MTSSEDVLHIPMVDGLIHEPARLRLLAFLCVLDRADFVFLLRHSGMSRGNMSVQMTRLSDADLVAVEKTFVDNRPRTTYSITKKGRQALTEYKHTMTAILDSFPD
ncbi:MAG: transcriptional regulator [Pseudomonadales bacterium]|jgi:DNA-binding MarR family transcriptional regulator|nr:transcriptional regulator [Pseudomonadales bacterium]MDP7144222.1 transcriptional regulator [Pseudomonadales bacterium]MDP7358853.1 transcriptional regulator [Pseudomonadales bacterium]MDP7594367.1 transcriptional regulator [Pseudomonadales bacterium]HJN49078.1 transcriptional regulator [Pseudomonadales bacterium]|tara:strand:+ start:205 stop:522 length:318 start_codon:yes stop_codon:yes gene_type:complete